MKQIIFILLLFFTSHVFSYPNFIGHKYSSCINCHYNPFGGGQLTDYGRGTSATLISSRSFYPKGWSDEKISESSGFLFRKNTQTWFRPQLNYRGFRIVENPNGSREKIRWITMQEDARITLKFGESDKLIFSGDYGRMPELKSPPPGTDSRKYRSRNLFVGYRFNSKLGIYTGLMDKVYGLRVVEHTSYSRINPLVTMNDQTYGAAIHFSDSEWEGGIHGFIGNTNQENQYRQKGISTMFEKNILDIHRIGASLMSSKSDDLTLQSISIHGRFNFKDGSALLTELGQTIRTGHNDTPSPTSQFGLIQAYVRPFRGLYLLTNVDYNKADISESPFTVRWGPAVQYFPIQRVELRADIYDTRNFSNVTATKDSWSYLLQTHLWF